MSEVRDVIALPLPAAQAQQRIAAFLRQKRQVPLRVPLNAFGLPDTLALERDVVIEAQIARDSENINDEIAISWQPTGHGPYPDFTGRLIVWSEETPAISYVELAGTYSVPLGNLGLAFDSTIGYLIAHATIHEFLLYLHDAVTGAVQTV